MTRPDAGGTRRGVPPDLAGTLEADRSAAAIATPRTGDAAAAPGPCARCAILPPRFGRPHDPAVGTYVVRRLDGSLVTWPLCGGHAAAYARARAIVRQVG